MKFNIYEQIFKQYTKGVGILSANKTIEIKAKHRN